QQVGQKGYKQATINHHNYDMTRSKLVEHLPPVWYNTIRARTTGPRPNLCERAKPMGISWLGHACFQLRGKNVVLITDPFPPQSAPVAGEGARKAKLNASIITVSHNHSKHSFVESVGGHPRVVRGPGEYEISDVLI